MTVGGAKMLFLIVTRDAPYPIYVCVYVYVYVYVSGYVYVCVYVCVFIYVYHAVVLGIVAAVQRTRLVPLLVLVLV